MYKLIFYFYILFVLFMISMFFSLFLYLMSKDFLVEWVVYSVNSIMMEVYMLVDWLSLLFISFVLLISSVVVLYSVVYMSGDKFLDRFIYLLLLFIFSMLLMILSPSLISILLGWDLLGLVSYCLVIYYQNYSSFNSGMVTVLSNRIGDVGILLAIGISLMYGSWNIYLLESKMVLFFMILVAAITKSAQMPFSTWLPMAMAAPTPVSSLVHSSTLVTAGVYLIIRFNNFIMISKLNFVLLYLAVLTMLMSGVMALYEFDLKKIIALSTLSQLGLMMMVLSAGLKLLGLYHLLTHAIFKSLLFLCAGALIHMVGGNQDIRCFGNFSDILPFVNMSFFISIMSLMGMPFFSGFYSKDLIMEMLYVSEVNLTMMLLILASLSLTVFYSLRLYYFLYFNELKLSSAGVMISEDSVMNISMMVLMVFSVVIGGLLNWLFFFDFYVIYLSNFIKLLTLFFLGVGGLMWGGWVSSKKVFYMKMLVLVSSSMWFLSYFYYWMNILFVFGGGYFKLIDSEWVENVSGKFSFKLQVSAGKFHYSNFKMYNIIYSQMFIILFMYFILMS